VADGAYNPNTRDQRAAEVSGATDRGQDPNSRLLDAEGRRIWKLRRAITSGNARSEGGRSTLGLVANGFGATAFGCRYQRPPVSSCQAPGRNRCELEIACAMIPKGVSSLPDLLCRLRRSANPMREPAYRSKRILSRGPASVHIPSSGQQLCRIERLMPESDHFDPLHHRDEQHAADQRSSA